MIYCIGDSHVSFFLGRDRLAHRWPKVTRHADKRFRVFHIGPATAYNLISKRSTTHSREKMGHILRELDKGADLLLSFGEIDIRTRAFRSPKLNEFIKTTCDRYSDAINRIRDRGFNVRLWLPPSTPEEKNTASWPSFGPGNRRNEVTLTMADRLHDKLDLPVLTVIPDVVDEEMYTREEYLLHRKIHLSQKAMAFANKLLDPP